MNIKSSPMYSDIQKILPLMVNLMVGVVKCCVGVLCPLKNSTYCKFLYRHHHLTSDDRSNAPERESRTSKGILEAKGAERFHIAGGMPALIWCGGMPNQIGTRSSKYQIVVILSSLGQSGIACRHGSYYFQRR